jgi:hypothetical protein
VTLTPTNTPTSTPTVTLTFTPTFTPTTTPTFTPTVTLTSTPTSTPTVTLTATPTSIPANRMVFLAPVGPFTAGVAAPVTLQLQSASSTPVTATADLSVNVTSSSSGEFTVNPSTFVLSTGVGQTVINYTDDKAASINLTASAALPTPGVSAAVSIQPAAYSKIQILFPGQVADPGRPTADPSGRQGGAGQIVADNQVNVAVNAVDAFFNLVNSVAGNVAALGSNDPANPPEGAVTFAAGSASGPVQFFTSGSRDITAVDGAHTGTSDTITVLSAALSPDLNVVHASPNISDVVVGQTGLTVFTFNLQVPVGQQTVQLNSLTVHATDQSGVDVAVNSAFTTLGLSYSGATLPLDVTGNNTALATLNGPISVTGTVMPVTLFADVAPAVTAKTVKFSIAGGAIQAQDVPSGTVTISTVGDPTGFPMVSGVMSFSNGDLAKTYGNYPNPFHAGSESTMIEFYLGSTSTVSLELYDVMGNRVESLLKKASLPAGLQRVPWDGRNGMSALVLNGIYYAQLDVNGTKLLLKIAVVK